MKNYEVIIFDLDGTISDSKEGITKSVQYALEKKGIIEDNLDNLNHFIGPPLKAEFMRAYGFTEDEAMEAVALYRERYIPIGIYEATMYDNADTEIKRLKDAGKFIALATSKPQPLAETVIEHFGLTKYFDAIKGADMIGPIQTKDQVIGELLKEHNIDKKQCVMIGDTCFDVDGAKKMGINTIGVSFGFGDAAEMKEHGALCVVDSFAELTKIILNEG